MQETINKVRKEVAKLHKSLNTATDALQAISIQSSDQKVIDKVRETFKKINEIMGEKI